MKITLNRVKRSQVVTRDRIDCLIRLLNLRRSFLRRKAEKLLPTGNANDVNEFRSKGLVTYKDDYLGINTLLDEVYDYCQGLLRTNAIKKQNKSGKDYLQHLVRRGDFDPASPVIRLAFNRELVGQVSRFLGDFPVIADIALLYSPLASVDTSEEFTGSQLFHMDADDTALCKVWFILEDVTIDDGPTVVVSKETSRVLAKKIGYHKSSRVKQDNLITGELEPNQIFTIVGNKKDLLFIDTANCFHYGSRVGKHSNGRFMLMISYSTSFALEHGFHGTNSPLKTYPTYFIDSQLNSNLSQHVS